MPHELLQHGHLRTCNNTTPTIDQMTRYYVLAQDICQRKQYDALATGQLPSDTLVKHNINPRLSLIYYSPNAIMPDFATNLHESGFVLFPARIRYNLESYFYNFEGCGSLEYLGLRNLFCFIRRPNSYSIKGHTYSPQSGVLPINNPHCQHRICESTIHEAIHNQGKTALNSPQLIADLNRQVVRRIIEAKHELGTTLTQYLKTNGLYTISRQDDHLFILSPNLEPIKQIL